MIHLNTNAILIEWSTLIRDKKLPEQCSQNKLRKKFFLNHRFKKKGKKLDLRWLRGKFMSDYTEKSE